MSLWIVEDGRFRWDLTPAVENHLTDPLSAADVPPCDPAVLACHHGRFYESGGPAVEVNRVLAYMMLTEGATLLRRVDMGLLDDHWGDRIVTEHLHPTLIVNEDEIPVPVRVVTSVDRDADEISVAVYAETDRAAADADFVRRMFKSWAWS